MKKISKNRQSFLARKAMHIYKSTVLFLPILGYFWLFLPICESVANLHESTLLFAPNIHAYFCLFFVIRPVKNEKLKHEIIQQKSFIRHLRFFFEQNGSYQKAQTLKNSPKKK